MNGWLQDLRVGWRSLARAPGFTIVVILVMGLGIGANTMVFNLANAFLFRSMPYIDANRNVFVYDTDARHQEDELDLSWPEFEIVRDRSRSFESVASYYGTQAYMTLGSEPERFDATAITSGLMRTYGAKPLLGREFLREEEEKSRSYGVLMLSERIWRERFHADPQVLGRNVKMNGRVRTIVGVAAPDFRFPRPRNSSSPCPTIPPTTSGARAPCASSRSSRPGRRSRPPTPRSPASRPTTRIATPTPTRTLAGAWARSGRTWPVTWGRSSRC